MTKLGRKPTKLTPVMHEAILECIRKGMPVTRICAYLRLSKSTFYNWQTRGRRGEEPFAKLLEDVEHAMAEMELNLLGVVRKSAFEKENWVAAMTLLERKWPENYGRNRDVTVTHRKVEEPHALAAINVIDVTNELDRRLGDGNEEEVSKVEEGAGSEQPRELPGGPEHVRARARVRRSSDP